GGLVTSTADDPRGEPTQERARDPVSVPLPERTVPGPCRLRRWCGHRLHRLRQGLPGGPGASDAPRQRGEDPPGPRPGRYPVRPGDGEAVAGEAEALGAERPLPSPVPDPFVPAP